MASVKIPARDIIMMVSDGATPTPLWIEIGGINSVTRNPAENEEKTDVTTYESEGNYDEVVMQRGSTLETEGFTLKDGTTGAQDPGQARAEVLGELIGMDSQGQIRFRHPMDTNWRIWTVTASLGEQGGENNDMTSWGVTFTRCGAATTAAVV